MTATTKEILGQFYSLYEGVTTAIPRPRDYREADRDRLFHLVLKELPSLLSDSECLAAIEAVTGGWADKLADYLSCVANGDPVSITLTQEAATAILSLSAKVAELEAENDGFISLRGELETLSSWQIRAQEAEAKVAEQAEEIERLRVALIQCGRNVGGFLADDVSTDFLMYVPEEARLRIQACNDLIAQSTEQRDSAIRCQAALIRERDTLRRLLTETAVPALEVADRALGHAKHRISQTVVFDALSTIRVQMEGGNAS